MKRPRFFSERLSWLMAVTLTLALCMSPGLAVKTSAAPITVGPSGADHTTIQAAIDAANPGDTITVADGTYNLITPVVVDEQVTLTGNIGAPGSVIVNAPTSGADREVFQVLSDNVTIQGFTIQGAKDHRDSGLNTNPGIALGGDAQMLATKPAGATDFTFSWWGMGVQNINISDNIITDNSYGVFLYHSQNVLIENNQIYGNTQDIDTWSGKGIAIYTSQDTADDSLAVGGTALPATNNVTINNNSIYDNELFGIELNHSETWNGGDAGPFDVAVSITNNTIYNNGGPWDNLSTDPWADVDVFRGITSNGNESNVTVTGNTIYGHNATSGTRFYSSNAGIRAPATSDWTISGNDIYDNTRGIYAYAGSTGIEVSQNSIHGNAQGVAMKNGTTGTVNGNSIYGNSVNTWQTDGIDPFGVVDLADSEISDIDATYNWWGDASGPTHAGNSGGSGDAVSDNVDYDPWAETDGNSDYSFSYDVPAGIVYNTDTDIDVTFATDVPGTSGYDGVRFAFEATGPGDVTFKATDTEDTEHTFTNSGYWGPGGGFDLPIEYSATTTWTLNFSSGGQYDIDFSLIYADDDTEIMSGSTTVTVTGEAYQVAFVTQPGGAVADTDFTTQPVVEIQDQWGSKVDSSASVGLDIKSGTGAPGANLSGTTPVSAVNGTATFSGLSIDYAWSDYVLTASSSGLVSADSEAFDVAASDSAISHTFSLNPGWNLVSLPLIPADSDITVLLDSISASIISVWSYDAATGTWSSYVPGAPSNSLTDMVDGQGYWINLDAEEATTLTVNGSLMPPGGTTLPPSYAVVEGWNLIGFKSTLPVPADFYLTGTDYRLPIYWYGLDTYYSVTAPGSSFQPGLGYWAYFNEAGTVTPSEIPVMPD